MVKIKRPVVVASIGYIIGILWGLYLKISIIPIFLLLFIVSAIIINKKIKRYVKLLVKNSFIVFSISAIIANITINNIQKEIFYKDREKINIEAIVLSNSQEKQYYNIYEIKITSEQYKGKKLLLKVKKSNEQLEYGSKIQIQGIYQEPEVQRNTFGFDYQKYLKSKGIQGCIVTQINNIKIKEKNALSPILLFMHSVKEKIENNFKQWLSSENSKLSIGLMLGDKSYLTKETRENFTNSSLAHLLVVSGTHISYLILGITMLLQKLQIGKRKIYLLTIIILILFAVMVGITPSITRATTMAIIILVSKLLYKKADILTSMGLSILIILIQNPYSILDIGLQLSYFATLGIILFYPIIFKCLNKKSKKLKKIKMLISVSVSAQIFIIPILACNFHTFSFNFLIANILASPLIAIIIIYGMFSVIVGSVYTDIGKTLCIFLNMILTILNWFAKMLGQNSWGNVLIARPSLPYMLAYYIFFICIKFINSITENEKTWDRMTNLEKKKLKLLKRLKINKNKYIKTIIILLIILIVSKFCFTTIIPQDLKINFVDVGQGDCTLIQTPWHKNILIDGGGTKENENFDVGENTLIPYLLNKQIKAINYMIVSHFDIDHVGGLLSVMKKIKVEYAVIAKQIENSENYEKFQQLAKAKRIKIIVVKKRRCIKY